MDADPPPVNPACRAALRIIATRTMTDRDSTRDERLAEALRANLRKRKAQAREGDEKPEPPKPRS